jgi:hypothetical protein
MTTIDPRFIGMHPAELVEGPQQYFYKSTWGAFTSSAAPWRATGTRKGNLVVWQVQSSCDVFTGRALIALAALTVVGVGALIWLGLSSQPIVRYLTGAFAGINLGAAAVLTGVRLSYLKAWVRLDGADAVIPSPERGSVSSQERTP